ncbi:hypothetical protein EHQ53_00135 [Leptospira langatensis]|uniref:Uncharacterized protein n=1 Tax=Leptospira langatensis TaxID=2484983 RepID=A0A5F1ZW54_9LEPT|nr:hypothetical protein [Leptospira langatensis]TGJ98181.1 hypothetical protein EHO57_16280 [Leptospira langatensis]TGL43095.1 hypothetical protein EHQ53_00135 [Leptospira langatensis]
MKKNIQKVLHKTALVLFIFFAISSGFKFDTVSQKDASPFPLSLKFGLLQPLHASADDWGFVRQSATWARGNSLFMDDIIAGIESNTLLVAAASGSTVTATNMKVGDGGGVFDVRLTLNNSGAEFSPTSTVYTGTKTFSNYFELKVTGTSTIALQFYWDNNPRDPSTQGALLLYNLALVAPDLWTATANIESYVYMPDLANDTTNTYTSYPLQGLIQTYSWSGPLGTDSELSKHAQRGRVILEEMDNRTVFCFKTVVRIDATTDLFPTIPSFSSKGLCQPGGTSNEYYKLAYSQKLTGDLNVTAKEGWDEGTIAASGTDTICGIGGTSLSYGLFNFNGFVRDHVAGTDIPSDYVPSSRVDLLYGRVGGQGKTGSGDANGVLWDDTTQATIDGLSVSFQTPPGQVGSLIPIN